MKKQIIILNALFVLFSLTIVSYKVAHTTSNSLKDKTSTFKATQLDDIDEGLVAYFSFSGEDRDCSGNGVQSVIVGAKPCTDRFGQPNSACQFDGKQDYVQIKNTFDYENRTVCFWFKAESAHDMDRLFISDNNSLKYGSTRIWLHYYEGVTFLMFSKWLSGEETIRKSIALNQWHFAALSIKGNSVSAYLDGELIETANNEYKHSSDGSELTFLGTNRKATNGFFNGQMDDIRMYNRDLSKTEIDEIYSLSETQNKGKVLEEDNNELEQKLSDDLQLETAQANSIIDYIDTLSLALYTNDNELYINTYKTLKQKISSDFIDVAKNKEFLRLAYMQRAIDIQNPNLPLDANWIHYKTRNVVNGLSAIHSYEFSNSKWTAIYTLFSWYIPINKQPEFTADENNTLEQLVSYEKNAMGKN